jgi:hypothetical protein
VGSALLPFGAVAMSLLSGSSSHGFASYSVGPQGHQIRIVAGAGQHLAPAVGGGTSAGTAVIPGAINYSTKLTLPHGGAVQVAVSVPSHAVAPAHARWIINDYFNNDPEQRVTWHGTSADLGVRRCNTPAGLCPGYVGGFQVFRDHVLYNVMVNSSSSDTAWAVIRSVRISS